MDSRLLVPATPALLDGWCGPVVLGRSRLVSVGVEGNGLAFTQPEGRRYLCSTLTLDLSRAECRDRVARVFASVVLGLDARAGVCVAFVRVPRGGVAIVFAVVLKGEHVTAAIDSITSPALAGLDPNDDTRLPDGSRWVDAAALAAVAREALRG